MVAHLSLQPTLYQLYLYSTTTQNHAHTLNMSLPSFTLMLAYMSHYRRTQYGLVFLRLMVVHVDVASVELLKCDVFCSPRHGGLLTPRGH